MPGFGKRNAYLRPRGVVHGDVHRVRIRPAVPDALHQVIHPLAVAFGVAGQADHGENAAHRGCVLWARKSPASVAAFFFARVCDGDGSAVRFWCLRLHVSRCVVRSVAKKRRVAHACHDVSRRVPQEAVRCLILVWLPSAGERNRNQSRLAPVSARGSATRSRSHSGSGTRRWI